MSGLCNQTLEPRLLNIKSWMITRLQGLAGILPSGAPGNLPLPAQACGPCQHYISITTWYRHCGGDLGKQEGVASGTYSMTTSSCGVYLQSGLVLYLHDFNLKVYGFWAKQWAQGDLGGHRVFSFVFEYTAGTDTTLWACLRFPIPTGPSVLPGPGFA
jgi:hypothetical protein